MNVAVTNNTLSNTPTSARVNSSLRTTQPNAFGIGKTNQPEVEVSAQARILQQNEQQQANRQQQYQQDEGADNHFVRVSSSEGSAQRNNLSAEKATKLYRSIEALL